MIRMVQCISSAQAKAYFSGALSRSDYYLDGQELAGRFDGRLFRRLDLAELSKATFHALCENVHPSTGDRLTPRTKEDRTVGYDINFHCPKSVSVLHALSKDDHLLEAFQESVREVMREIETDAKARVRSKGQYAERETGELAWAEFVHQTARPVDGSLPDPHLHAHCFVFNATWDAEEGIYKAGQFRDIKRDMPYYQALFHKHLSDRLLDLGYQIRRTDKAFEVEGVPERVIDLFSKRTNEIGQVARESGITDAKDLDALGARTRAKKQKGLTMAELKAEWKRQILATQTEDGDSEGDTAVRFVPEEKSSNVSPQACIDYALVHCFERASVMHDRRLLAVAYRHGLGSKSVSADAIAHYLYADRRIIHVKEKGRTMCTTREVLAEEKRMVDLVRKGQGQLEPLYRQAPNIDLEGQQYEAVAHILTATDQVSIIRGAAGTGKTTLLREAKRWIERWGKELTVVAPTSDASRGVLRLEGFEDADTVARLLADENMQEGLQDGILLVDEAGLLGTKDMTGLLTLAASRNARLLLVGDTRQHASVARGDALRILNTVAGIRAAEVSRIYRQKDARYRMAVEHLSNGEIGAAFEKLNELGALKTIDPMQPYSLLANDYLQTVRKGKSALVVSPTHAQGEAATAVIRAKLKAAGKIGRQDIPVTRRTPLNLTGAEKTDLLSYRPGLVVQFNQNIQGGIRRGSVWQVDQVGDQNVRLNDGKGNSVLLPKDMPDKFEVYRNSFIGLAKGDRVRITRNGFDLNEKRLNNGQMLEVAKVTEQGDVILRNRQSRMTYRLGQDFGHLAHAYCVTSHASQGKTVDEVFIMQPAATFPATNQKQFYVSVSRARERVRIYTDDHEALLNNASRMGDRQSAIELVHGPGPASQKETIAAVLRLSCEKPVQTVPVQRPVIRDPLNPLIAGGNGPGI